MNTLLFISDDMRAAELVVALQTYCLAKIRLAPDFDQGLREVFDNRPAVVFIQSEISGISGETVARHIKTLLRGDSPRIVLSHSSPLKLQGGKKWFDDTIDLSLPEEELRAAFRSQVTALGAELWLEPPVAGAASPSFPEPLPPDETPPIAGEQQFHPPESEREFEFSDWEIPGPGQEPPVAAETPLSFPPLPAEEESQPPVSPLRHSLSSPPPTEPRRVTTVADFNADAADEPPAMSVSSGRVEAEPVRAGSRALLWSVVGVMIVAAICTWAILFRGSPPTVKEGKPAVTLPAPPAAVPAPAPHVPPSTPRQAALQRLPSFIPPARRDASYARSNPGWERYVGKTMEFRLFSENGTLRAVQLVTRGGGSLPPSFLDGVFKELTGASSRTVLTRSAKGKLVVERGRTAGNGEFVVYRQNRGPVRGVVISLP
ncbi:hypothetical protein [Geobacter sp.]|uniref:hypothetical protein n=1 Tax=Geobacter sp. TaxID=46610 RepID=UPI0026156312|nr:hypothetical protein [Geobacter sp.]